MKNPEAFFSMIATPEVKPFDPKPEIFPASWISLRLLQIYAVSKVSRHFLRVNDVKALIIIFHTLFSTVY